MKHPSGVLVLHAGNWSNRLRLLCSLPDAWLVYGMLPIRTLVGSACERTVDQNLDQSSLPSDVFRPCVLMVSFLLRVQCLILTLRLSLSRICNLDLECAAIMRISKTGANWQDVCGAGRSLQQPKGGSPNSAQVRMYHDHLGPIPHTCILMYKLHCRFLNWLHRLQRRIRCSISVHSVSVADRLSGEVVGKERTN